MINAYFLSDVHLDFIDTAPEREKREQFAAFLKKISADVTHLYLVGDLFDFWFEYKYVIPKAFFEFLKIFSDMTARGVEIHYLAGNHDFYAGTFFEEHLGMRTWPDSYEFELGGKRFYLYHGDGIGKKDGAYRVLKKILRNRLNLRLFRWLHPDLGIPLARRLSGSSRHYTSQLNHLRDESDYKAFAGQRFSEGFDFVMMGHRHNPLVHEKDEHRYINLGDWIRYRTFAYFNGKELSFMRFHEGEMTVFETGTQ
ncbi:MAG TPA: UDP-2,3-diacylglucosamine diphosphatase [Caldithrix abyssi]|uniref:UDP-2,3-diacylglucosamine diphosphatase n=1 Tax=Caldithrix abyssi TaxID=187145 RepID=A0A7V5VED1_CALAY|nr:UDP-2,3-diacylglucosamine diphosphatase [Caldithrix abyssi]